MLGMNEFKCAVCGKVFQKETPESEALAELGAMFGDGVSPDDCVLVCDGCWKGKILPSLQVN